MSAHPLIMDSTPSGLERLTYAPSHIIITYSEAVDEKFSYIRVMNSNGERVDNGDSKYYNSDTTLIVTLKPSLPDDVYSVNSRVLSKVDGHIVDYTFSFIVGDVEVAPTKEERTEVIYIPDTLARFPGIVGQFIIVGIGFGSLYLWKNCRELLNDMIKEAIPDLKRTTSKLYIIGAGLVIISSIATLTIQSLTLGTVLTNVIETSFGMLILLRLIIGFIALSLYLVLRDNTIIYISILIVGLSLLFLSSATGHSATSLINLSIDFVHNTLAALWIGMLFYLLFTILPSLKRLGEKNVFFVTLIIPRFSKVAIVTLGILAISGPVLLLTIEDDLNLLLRSSYGMILIIKLSLVALMVASGGYNQIIHKRLLVMIKTREETNYQIMYNKFKNSIRIEVTIGIILLLSIAFLTNTGLPASEFPFYDTKIEKLSLIDNTIPKIYNSTLIDDVKITLTFTPARIGLNTFILKVTDINDQPLDDLLNAKLKLRQIGKDVSPLVIDLVKIDDTKYIANGTITSNGRWFIEVNVERSKALSISKVFSPFIKPDLDEMKFELKEYALPYDTLNPLHAIYNNGYIWISDGVKPRLWRFDITNNQFESYTFNGTSIIRLADDSNGKIWFTDPLSRQFGYFDPKNGGSKIFKTYDNGLPTDIYIDSNDHVWLALIDKDIVTRFDASNEEFKIYRMQLNGSQPAVIAEDNFGNIWISEAIGKLAKLDINGNITEFTDGDRILGEPFALLISDNTIWIAEHLGGRITRFDPLLHTFHSFNVTDARSLPYGMTKDNFGNIWFAQHVLDKIGVLDPITGKIREIEISSPSWVQALDKDEEGNIWFAEPRQSKIGVISIKQVSVIEKEEMQKESIAKIRYADVIMPLMTAFIVTTSLLFVKTTYSLRESIKIIKKLVRKE
ncbi:MAG: CopD family protein [Candidatus Nitrosocaldaceae archaeon]